LDGSHNVTQTKFAYGAGVSSKLPLGFSVRAEYERIASPFGDPDAFTVSALWTF
jgi:opacity protein-like surface antigen